MNILNHRHISSRQQQDPLFRRIWGDPYLDWSIMLACVAILIVTMTFLGYRVYVHTYDALRAPLTPTSGSNKAVFDEETLSKVLGNFRARSSARAEIIRGTGIPGDPSI
ncbi:MAG: hypothetical protein RLY66_110 [Candidatus Parcubacteria bacterium]|jgi:hypothetical protein